MATPEIKMGMSKSISMQFLRIKAADSTLSQVTSLCKCYGVCAQLRFAFIYWGTLIMDARFDFTSPEDMPAFYFVTVFVDCRICDLPNKD